MRSSPTHCKDSKPKIRNKYSQKWNCAPSVPIPTFVFLWVIYIIPRSLCLFCYRKIGGPILRIYTVGEESLCRCRWKVRYLRPLDLKSQMTLKCFHYEFGRWKICRPLSWYNMNCLEFVIFLLPVPKMNKLSVPIFWRKKEILPLMGGKIFFLKWREMLFNRLRWAWSEK